MFRVLVVEDDFRMRGLIKELLEKQGYSVTTSHDGKDAFPLIKEQTFDVILTDLRMPDIDGMEVLSRAREASPCTPVIMLTGFATVDSAVEAMKRGAYDYIQKPFEPDALLLAVKRAAEYHRLADENLKLSAELERCSGQEFIGSSKAILELKKLVEKVAPLDTTVLIQGETGTGKEMIARLINRLSPRAEEKFLPVNCGALPETLIEAELFGYEKGSFTGAAGRKKGLFESANRGTLFLDEINNASRSLQIKLLRVLQEGSFLRVGGVEPVTVDVRVIAACNADLAMEVDEGRFRKDLFYRLNVITLSIPPLRERKDDIPYLASHFLAKYAKRFSKEIKSIAPEAMAALAEYPWPGNVRELENCLEHAVVIEGGSSITARSLPAEVLKKKHQSDPFMHTGVFRIEETEKFLIQRALSVFDGQKTKAAEALGISITTLWRKLKKLNLE
ncbi:MAG: sigma-54 dependent transcriptional regulator [Nitrospiraceae bacterium]|nr:sigma-54 dependent transcriptional regulator [Nitrospiraceae bacterium]MDA8169082.1 sigma-54 dependent transcriptional regulator [Nitrospiraceae bacterium]